MICPNLQDTKVKEQFEELIEAVGENAAYELWNKNGGYPLDKTPDGKDSKLFKDLLELTGDRISAIEAKAKTYSPEFSAWFGDWHRAIRVGKNKSTTKVKTGIPELFESNPELANQVYETLGFNQFQFELLNKYSSLNKSTLSKKEEAVAFLQSLDGKKLFSPSEMLMRISKAETSKINKGLSDYLNTILERYKGIYAEESVNPYRLEFKENLKLSNDDTGIEFGTLGGYNQAGKKFFNLDKIETRDIITTILHEFAHDIEPFVRTKDGFISSKAKNLQTSLTEKQKELGNKLNELRRFTINYLTEDFKKNRVAKLEQDVIDYENGKLLEPFGKPASKVYIDNLKREIEKTKKVIENNEVEKYIEKSTNIFFYRSHYGLSNINEFIAEALTNEKFREVLNDIPYKNTTLLSYLFELFQKILGIKKDTVLSEALNLIHELATTKREQLNEKQITPQQKQQAQQLYSQYLDTIFPDSSVKEIIYHGSPKISKDNAYERLKAWEQYQDDEITLEEYNKIEEQYPYNSKIEKFDKSKIGSQSNSGLNKGFYFSTNKNVSLWNNSNNLYKVIVNIKNPTIIEGNGEKIVFQKLKDAVQSNDVIYKNTIDALEKNDKLLGDTIVIQEPEQIHILGSKQDIEGFKEFVNSNNEVSKVIDTNGEPLVVYHGTNEKFEEFRKDKIGTNSLGNNAGIQGFHFVDNRAFAKTYAEWNINTYGVPIEVLESRDESLDSGVAIPTYLSIKDNKSGTAWKIGNNINEYISFEPNQIKSVFNQGEFSETNDNIYHQLDENYETKILKKNELLPADPKLHEKIEKFLNDRGFDISILRDVDTNWVAKTDILRRLVEVVEGKENMSTLPEEAAHIIVEMLPENSPLLQKMMKDITSFEGYREVFNKYSGIYVIQDENGEFIPDEIKIKKEAIGKVIANEIINEFKKESEANKTKLVSWLQRVLNWLKQKLGSNALQVFDKEVNAYREVAKMVLENRIPDNLTKLTNEKDKSFLKNLTYYQLEDNAEDKVSAVIKKLEKSFVIKKKDGYYRLDGTKVSKRVTDYVNRFYRSIFGEREESEMDKTLRMKGSYIHKLMEFIVKEIIATDVDQAKSMSDIVTEVRNRLSTDTEIFKKAARELIAENEDFAGMNEDDNFFVIGRNDRGGKPLYNAAMFRELIDLGLAKYRNIKEKQANINAFTGTKGKFRIFTELMVYDEKDDTAGTIDMAVVYSNSSVGIYDWKGVRFDTNDNKEIVVEESIKDYKERAWEIQILQYKRILKEQYGIEEFAETRMIPINVQLNFKNPNSGFHNIEAGNKNSKKTYLNEVPVADELITNEVHGYEYLNNSLRKLFSEKDKIRKQLEASHGNLSLQSKLDRVNKIIKGIQLRKEFQIIIEEMQNLINEFDSLEHHTDNDNRLTPKDVTQYMEYATMFKEVLTDLIAAINNDDKLKQNASVVRANLEIFAKRLNIKMHDLVKNEFEEDIDNPYTEESYLGKTFKSLYNLSAPVFKVMRKVVGEMQNSIRLQFNEKHKKVQDKTDKLKAWAENKGLTLQQAYDKIIVETKGDLKLVSKYNGLFFDERSEARKNKNTAWFLANTMVVYDDVLKEYSYSGKALERFNKVKEGKLKNIDTQFAGKDQEKRRLYEREKWLKRYDITLNPEALFSENNYFIYMIENDKYLSDFWKEATQSGNEALREYYEMYIEMNEEFANMTDVEINSRFIANVTKDLVDSIGENGITAFGRIPGMVRRSLEVEQNDLVFGSTSNGEHIKKIPLMYSHALTEPLTKEEIATIEQEVKNIKDDKGNQKYTGLAYEDIVNAKKYELSKKKGNLYKSRDLSKSLLLFANSALTYKHLKDTEDIAKGVLYYIKSGAGFHYPTDRLGNRKRDAFTDLLSKPELGIPPDEIKLFEKFMEAIWYGYKTQGKDKVFNLWDKNYSVTKGVQKAMQYISIKALGLNAFVAAGNFINTYSTLMMSGSEGTIFKGAIRKTMTLLREDKKKFSNAVALFETFAHDERFEKANHISASTVSKYLTMDNAYALMKYPDKGADQVLLIAMMHRYGVQNGKLTKFDTDDNPNSLINLLKYNEATDSWSIEGLSDKDFAAFRQAVLHMSYKIKGTRSENNVSATDLTLMQQAMMQFRNWMPGVIDNRFSSLKYDDVLMDFNQGRFIVFAGEFLKGTVEQRANSLWNLTKEMFLIKSFSAKDKKINLDAANYYFMKFLNEHPEYKGKISLEQYLQMREGKLRGMATELRSVLIMYLLMMFLGRILFGDDDEKKKNQIAEFFSRNSYRLANRGLLELTFFFDPASTFRSFYISPIALFKPIKDLGKVWKNTADEFKDSIYGENSPNDKTDWLYYGQDYIPFSNQVIDFFDFFGTWEYGQEYN